MKIIPDLATAHRVGIRKVCSTPGAIGFHEFSYTQPRSGLTLYGVALRMADGTECEVRTQ